MGFAALREPGTHSSPRALLASGTFRTVSAPIWTALLWSGSRRWSLIALIAVVQLPVAVIGFVPIINPMLHLALFGIALGITAASLRLVRREARAVPAPETN